MNGSVRLLLVFAALVAAACGDGQHGPMMVTGPGGSGADGDGFAFMSIAPAGGSTGVATSTSITLRFGGPMAAGMEQYVDLHVGSLTGPTVPMSCAWSADRTTLTCTPAAALDPRTMYLFHLGGGMATQAGKWVDFGPYGPMMGGQWITGAMMGGSHAGRPWGSMGSAWHGADAGYGMAFPFTTG